MKIKSITVTYEIKTNDEENQILSLLAIRRGQTDSESNARAEKKEAVAYTPSGDRTRLALEALGKCKRVRLLRTEALESWALAYPNVNLAGEILKAEAWAESKSVTRSPRGWQKAMNFWLSKAQDNSKVGANMAPGATVSSVPIVPENETAEWLKAAS